MDDRAGGTARTEANDNHVSVAAASSNIDSPPSLSELPFLVTHWLANYQESGEGDPQDRKEAIERLRNAASEMACAFSALGAYGTSTRVCDLCVDFFCSSVLNFIL